MDLKKETKKEILKDLQTDNLKLLIKDVQKDAKHKESLPQRDNSKATSQKEDNKLKNNVNKEQTYVHVHQVNKDNVLPLNVLPLKDQPINPTEILTDLLIGTITNAKMTDFRNTSSTASSSKESNQTSTLDDLRIKIIESIHLKAKIFFQAITGNQFLKESAGFFIKNKNDGLKLNSIYSSTPYLKPFQSNPPSNSNNFCSTLTSSFNQYSQMSAFLLAAFLLFPLSIPLYLIGWITLALLRGVFCIGARQLITNVIYKIRST